MKAILSRAIFIRKLMSCSAKGKRERTQPQVHTRLLWGRGEGLSAQVQLGEGRKMLNLFILLRMVCVISSQALSCWVLFPPKGLQKIFAQGAGSAKSSSFPPPKYVTPSGSPAWPRGSLLSLTVATALTTKQVETV